MKKIFLALFLVMLLFVSGCIFLNNSTGKKSLKKEIPCFEGYEKDTNLCFLYDKQETYFFVTNCKNQFPKKYTAVSVVEDEPECKLKSATKYNKIAPSFIPQEEDYPDYNKCNEKICLICEYHCNVNHDLLDWRFDKLTHLYDKLAELFGREKLLDVPIKYIIYDQKTPLLVKAYEDYGSATPIGGGNFGAEFGWVQIAEGLIFNYFLTNEHTDPTKMLHTDYPDYVYETSFENENVPVHEMLHAVFAVRYGNGFSGWNFSHIFTTMVDTHIGWHTNYESHRMKAIGVDHNPPQSFCDEKLKLHAYPHLYYLCKDYGFDVDDLPAFFDELDKIKEQNKEANPEHKGQLSHDDIIDAVSTVVGKDASKVFSNVCYVNPDYPDCKK